MKNFRTFNLAVEFYRSTKTLPLTGNSKEQLKRASLSIPLNLAEGSERHTLKEKKRFYNIALGSLREVQAIMLIEALDNTTQFQLLDKLAAHLYNLIKKGT
ncbi:MAG: four helix bundle protein [Proteobacteria bacterium]|nr:four helix bundle protein [Pseudomonadota bacterium]